MLPGQPFPFIFSEGDVATQLTCLAFFDLARSHRGRECLLELIARQRADGAFPSRLDPLEWGMRETVRHALLLLAVGVPPASVNVDRAVRFVLDRQRPDGGWCENESLETPPGQTWLSSGRSITWLTADVVELLRQVELGAPACRAAVDWLRSVQNQDGGWPSLAPELEGGEEALSDPDASAQIAFLLGEINGQDDASYLRGRALFEQHLDDCARDAERGYRIRRRDGRREEIEVYHLTHLLLSWPLDRPRRIESGYDVTDPRVERMMEALVDLQRPDGGWRPFWAQGSSAAYTVLAVKCLVLTGLVARRDLAQGIRSFAV
jgi:hypothetical protein